MITCECRDCNKRADYLINWGSNASHFTARLLKYKPQNFVCKNHLASIQNNIPNELEVYKLERDKPEKVSFT